MTQFLTERGLTREDLNLVGARWESTGRILYPRLGRREDEPTPPLEVPVVGWKVRDIVHGRQYNTPGGIPASLTWPLLVRDVLPATGVMIVEGETDMMRLASSGLASRFSSDVLCVPGADSFQHSWVPLVRTYERVICIPDGDEAGIALPESVASLVPGTRNVTLPGGHDICSFLMTHAVEDLATLIQSAPIYLSQKKIRRINWDWKGAQSHEHREKIMRIISQDVTLRKKGDHEFIGRCPFHDDSTPSFSVNPIKGLYRCWSCGESGDVITYLRKKRDMSFRDAMKTLEEMS